MSQRLKSDIQRLARTRAQLEALIEAGDPAAILASDGLGLRLAASGTGIASPITEADYTTRTWHDAREIYTTDGIFTFIIEDLKTVDMMDGNGAPVQFVYAEFAT